jgi:hypothetical protein
VAEHRLKTGCSGRRLALPLNRGVRHLGLNTIIRDSEMKRSVIRSGTNDTSIANLAGSCVLLLFLLLISSNASAAGPTSLLDGHWTGAMTREGRSWAVNLDIESSAKNPVVLVDLVDYGIYALPFSLSAGSNSLRLERKQP